MTTYNPFPTLPAPVWFNSGTCYSTAWYADEEVARQAQALQREKGGHVNGGYMHGLPLGDLIPSTQPDGSKQWGVTC